MLDRLPSGCDALDQLLGGGFESGIITQVYGEAGSGKSNIAIQLSIQAVVRGFRVIFIDAEGFSPERFRQIAGEGAKDIASKIVIFEPLSLEEQHSAIRDASKIVNRDFGLVVVDSATALYRAKLDGEDNRAVHRSLTAQLGELQTIARKHRLPVLITNQVYTELELGILRPLGGTAMQHASKTIIFLEKAGEGRRRARLFKHRSQPEGATTEFRITAKGLE